MDMRLVSSMVKDQRLSADSLANKSEHWYRWITFKFFFMGGRCMTQHMKERQKKGKEKSEDLLMTAGVLLDSGNCILFHSSGLNL